MPTYPLNKTFKGGFYSNKNVDGVDDRVYSAEDIRKPYDVIYSDGIKPDVDGTEGDTLKVIASGGMSISVKPGFAKLGGAWFENTANYTITLDNPTAADRYDCVILRNDDSEEVREPSIYIKSLPTFPKLSDLVRNDKVYEVCLACITITSSLITITDSIIYDTRTSGDLCNIMSGVGATVVRTFKNTYYSESANQQTLPIGIEGFNASVDELVVAVEGSIFSEGTQYEIVNNTSVKLVIPLPVVGTRIDFTVRKNVNGSVNDSTNQEVTQLIQDVSNIKNVLTHDYYCTGVNDNIAISELVKTLLQGSGYGSVKLNIHGTFGAYQPAIVGSTTDYWFDFNVTSNRKVLIDFTDCSQIITPITSGKVSVLFYGKAIYVTGVNYIANNTDAGTSIVVFDSSLEVIICDNSRFWITANKYSYVARHGTFTNCRASVTNSLYYSYCFYSDKMLRLFGGEYYAYTADSGATSAVVGHTGSDTVTIMYGVNAPTVARSGYYQTNSIKQMTGGMLSCTDLISTLSLDIISGSSNIRGTMVFNKPGLM